MFDWLVGGSILTDTDRVVGEDVTDGTKLGKSGNTDGGAEVVGKDEDGNPIRRLEVPISHAQQWFSSLNQARLVMGDVHDLYDEDGNVRPRENEAFSDFHHRWRIYDRSNFYALIQEWLISRMLDQ